MDLRGLYLRRLGRDARRLDRHRHPADSGRRRRGRRCAARREPHRVHPHLLGARARLHGDVDPHVAERELMDLVLLFTAVMGFAILLYVLLDGYDLGIGMLMPAASREEQELMVGSIAPFSDANETWLVLGIALLLVAFPAAHGEILGALYLPVAAMLVGLMLRGVAFELRVKAEGWHRELWNWLFWA